MLVPLLITILEQLVDLQHVDTHMLLRAIMVCGVSNVSGSVV